MANLSRTQFLEDDSMPTAEVPVPELGDADTTVRVRGLSSKDRFQWRLSMDKALAGNAAPEPTAHLVVLAAIDDDGARLFPSVQDVDAIAEKRGDVIERIADKVMELSGMTDAAAKQAGKDSSTTPSGSSPTDSPETSGGPSAS